ncbi:HNH endonuclease [Luteimonas sp BLCC-B24]|uniref:HNH endonuclease n=1 Tax=Luteimonas sp. BLCC-B24 TaxID=3025317 RepID=UPI00234C17CC|nr:HNH endonuclease [Luteimonas sp. BLCC-B24]MDC7807108.1 HNH endonuclease [Luteimonas sp. BLCC-B24]
MNILAKRAGLVAASADKVKRCHELWGQRKNKAFQEIREKLGSSCSGRVRCMYCEDSEATDIEHFRPKSIFTEHAFDWENYLLACSNCNSNYKRSKFPLDGAGFPLLINPMNDDPMDHLDLSLSTGKFVASSHRGIESIRVFGLDRQVLEDGRRDAWSIFCALVARYSAIRRDTSADSAGLIVSAIQNQSFSCVSLYARKYYLTGVLSIVAPQDVCRILDDNPEIFDIST